MKRRYEVEMTCTVTLEVDDEVVSDSYPGETILTAHENRDRFVEGSTLETALFSLACGIGVDGRRTRNLDGWADFPEDAVDSRGFPDWSLNAVYPTPPPADDTASAGDGSGRDE
jgi:hypothetical protein